MMVVKAEIPTSPLELRAYCAIHWIKQTAIARHYGESGCCQQWIACVLNEERQVSGDVIERIREAIQKVEEERRCQRRIAS